MHELVLMEEGKLKIMRGWGRYSKPCGHGSKKAGSRVTEMGRSIANVLGHNARKCGIWSYVEESFFVVVFLRRNNRKLKKKKRDKTKHCQCQAWGRPLNKTQEWNKGQESSDMERRCTLCQAAHLFVCLFDDFLFPPPDCWCHWCSDHATFVHYFNSRT